jgi:hypothetical protein
MDFVSDCVAAFLRLHQSNPFPVTHRDPALHRDRAGQVPRTNQGQDLTSNQRQPASQIGPGQLTQQTRDPITVPSRRMSPNRRSGQFQALVRSRRKGRPNPARRSTRIPVVSRVLDPDQVLSQLRNQTMQNQPNNLNPNPAGNRVVPARGRRRSQASPTLRADRTLGRGPSLRVGMEEVGKGNRESSRPYG